MDQRIEPSAEALDMGRQLVEGLFRKELGLEPADLRYGLDIAKALIERGQLERAMRIYAALVLCDPVDPDYQVGLANCALVQGENHLALQAASAVIVIAPTDPRGWLLSGRACAGMAAYAEAAEDLAEAAALAGRSGESAIAAEAERLRRQIQAMAG
ncbi:tetratricopeptide repeat protein [Prosthecomicrobium sp. N25]|uniref:tetratricopeptide repeat protein n=1 Tax=Prosthecomicrobium sp. N25 TaxID=3129254 RepID=UPI0030768ABD